MSDDTTRTDRWGSAETPGGLPESGAQSAASNAAERVGFCQDCGKPLTPETARIIGTGVFCEPCLAARVGATTTASGYVAVPPPAAAGEPSPSLAWLLGLIPGVGAMYNGQLAKGIVHLVIFATLVSLSNNMHNEIFKLFVFGWILYMAFEAHHTAIARRDGLPLPNAFGFNDIGERMGFGSSWGAAGSAKVGASGTPPPPGTTPSTGPIPRPEYVPVNTASAGTSPDRIGYVPPTAFAAQPVSTATSQPTIPGGYVPYAATYTGAYPPAYNTEVPPIAVVTDPAARRFPTSALWLIGLGVLILAANLSPDWNLTERWWPPVLFAGLSVWVFTRRLRSGARLVCIIRWPITLMVLAIMLALHAAYFAATFGLTCSVLLIVFGVLLLLERTAGATPVHTPPVVTAAYPETLGPADVRAEDAHSRAAWAATNSGEVKSDPDNTTPDNMKEEQ